MKKRLIMVIVSIVLSVAVCLVATGSTPLSSSTANAYMEEELVAVMKTVTADELIPVDIWLNEVDTDKVETVVAQKIEAQKQRDIQIFGTETVTDESKAIDTYIETKRETYAELQTKSSEDFLSKYTRVFDSRNSEEKLLFVSKYTPVIRANLTVAEINDMARDLSVQGIFYSPEIKMTPETNISVPLVRANYVRDTLDCTGVGIKIGMVEVDSLPDLSLGCFVSSNIIYEPNITATDTEHASIVAAIMVAKSVNLAGTVYKGIVPDAKLYVTSYDGSQTDWRYRVEWLLSKGVHVINMSAGSEEGTGIYSDREMWLDHIAINHSVHFVNSSGNTGYYITSPGMAYNIITVGNLNDKDTASYDDDEIAESSSYEEIANSNMVYKPDLIAPGMSITTAAGTNSGTSFAAPHVTAIIAQLCERHPTLKTKQDAMKAILTASINHSVHAYTPDDYNYDRYGAGMVDARSAMYTADNSRYVTSYFDANSADGSKKTYTFTVKSTDTKVRISLAWLKYSYLTGSHPTAIPGETQMGDLDLIVKNSSGTVVGRSDDVGNVEIVQLNNPAAGKYTIEVLQYSNSNKKVYFGLAWW